LEKSRSGSGPAGVGMKVGVGVDEKVGVGIAEKNLKVKIAAKCHYFVIFQLQTLFFIFKNALGISRKD
jgi:hypothetical protein